MQKKNENENEKEQYIRLYEKYMELISKSGQNVDLYMSSTLNAALPVVILAVGEEVFQVKFPIEAYIISIFVGGLSPLVPSITNHYKISRTEHKLFDIVNKNCISVVDSSNPDYQYYHQSEYKKTYLENYYNYIKQSNNDSVKKLKK